MSKIKIYIESADQFVNCILSNEDEVIGKTLWKVRKAVDNVLLIDLHRPNLQAYCDIDIIKINDILNHKYILEIYHCKLRDEFININRDNYEIYINDALIPPPMAESNLNLYRCI